MCAPRRPLVKVAEAIINASPAFGRAWVFSCSFGRLLKRIFCKGKRGAYAVVVNYTRWQSAYICEEEEARRS